MHKSLLLLFALGCGASSAEIRQARDASYQTEYDRVWETVLATVGEQYEIHHQDKATGVISTTWKKVERTAETTQDNQAGGGGAVFFRAQVILRGGPPWTPVVDGVAGELRPGLAVMTPFEHGAADEPPWVEGRIDGLYVAIHQRLQQVAVYGVKPGPRLGGATAAAPDAEIPVAPPAPTISTPGPAN